MIVVGGSLGGMKALQTILRGLPASFSQPIAVVLHRHKESDDSLIEIIQHGIPFQVKEVTDKDPIRAGHVYLSPSDYHLLVEPMYFSLSIDEPVQYARPSIDVLFESAADILGDKIIGVILTGANHDGARGAEAIRRKGGIVIVQDPLTAECPVMPAAALQTVPDAVVRPTDAIAALLVELTSSTLTP
jgi:two-component system chemotaxis response regulator CheB